MSRNRSIFSARDKVWLPLHLLRAQLARALYAEGEGRKFIADWTNLIPKLRNYARTPRNFFHPYRKLPFYTQLESLSNIILSRANNFSGIDRSDGTIEAVDPEKLHATILKYTARGSKSSNRSTYKEYTDYIYIYISGLVYFRMEQSGERKKKGKRIPIDPTPVSGGWNHGCGFGGRLVSANSQQFPGCRKLRSTRRMSRGLAR